MAKHNDSGQWGEDIAAQYFISKGYAITERNWRYGHFELDLVVQRDNSIIFVEVKTRTTDAVDFYNAVDRRKQQRLITAANAYLRLLKIDLIPQFDVVGVIGNPSAYTIEHIEDAFYPRLRTFR